MSDDITTPETKVTLSVQQLEGIIRKVVREELVAFTTQEQEILKLDKDSPIYEDMQDMLERKKSGQLKFHTHEKVWNE